MAQLDRLRAARRELQQAAQERWRRREDERAKNKQEVAAGGVGAADSPQRNARFQLREASFEQARQLRRLGQLPFGIERRMGPTLDYTPFAPSEAARTAGRPVARIVETLGPGMVPRGLATGFLVTPRLLLTNHHVFPSAAEAVGTGANFLFEQTDRGLQAGVVFEIDPDAFYLSDEQLDYALVAVNPSSIDGRTLDDLGIIALIEAVPKILIGQPVNIVQYPHGGPKQYAIKVNRLVDIVDQDFLHYETDTLEGSSGAPAFSINWELVALHHIAIAELRDGKVVATDGSLWTPDMGDDRVHWIANEGIRVSAIVKSLTRQRLDDPAQRAMLQALLATTTDPVDDLTRQVPGGAGAAATTEMIVGRMPAAPGGPGGAGMANNVFNFSGPVTIHVYAPAAASVTAAEATRARPEPRAQAVEASIRFDPNYADREGYDPHFLDLETQRFSVPVPGVVDGRLNEMLRAQDGTPRVLKYHHFELVMNEQRRLQMWSAANVDYNPSRKSNRSREAFGSDRWIPDPRIPAMAQIFDADFYKPAGNIDRGHVVRRDDNAWGDSELEIEFANSDTFHWTNCTPQHEAFNQSDPARNDPTYRGMKGLWGDFENHIQASLQGVDSKACILAGPVLDNQHDPTADFGRGPIPYPLRFWKVVAVTARKPGGSGRRLRVFGFILSQKPVVDRFGIEAFGPGKFRRYQVSLRQITLETGVTFDDSLHAADALQGARAGIAIEKLDDVRGLSDQDEPMEPSVSPEP